MKKMSLLKLAGLGGCAAALGLHEKERNKKLQEREENERKMTQYYRFLNRWLILKQKGE